MFAPAATFPPLVVSKTGLLAKVTGPVSDMVLPFVVRLPSTLIVAAVTLKAPNAVVAPAVEENVTPPAVPAFSVNDPGPLTADEKVIKLPVGLSEPFVVSNVGVPVTLKGPDIWMGPPLVKIFAATLMAVGLFAVTPVRAVPLPIAPVKVTVPLLAVAVNA